MNRQEIALEILKALLTSDKTWSQGKQTISSVDAWVELAYDLADALIEQGKVTPADNTDRN